MKTACEEMAGNLSKNEGFPTYIIEENASKRRI